MRSNSFRKFRLSFKLRYVESFELSEESPEEEMATFLFKNPQDFNKLFELAKEFNVNIDNIKRKLEFKLVEFLLIEPDYIEKILEIVKELKLNENRFKIYATFS